MLHVMRPGLQQTLRGCKAMQRHCKNAYRAAKASQVFSLLVSILALLAVSMGSKRPDLGCVSQVSSGLCSSV